MIAISTIQEHVAASFGIRLDDMMSMRRRRSLVQPRQVAMYLSRQLTPRSYPQIAFQFNRKDHTTAMWAVERVTMLILKFPDFAAKVAGIRRELETEPEHV